MSPTPLSGDLSRDHVLRVTVTLDLTERIGDLLDEFPAEWNAYCQARPEWTYQALLDGFARESGHIFRRDVPRIAGWKVADAEVTIDPPREG